VRIVVNVPDGIPPALALGIVAGAIMDGRTMYSLNEQGELFSIEDEPPSMDLRLEIIAALSGGSALLSPRTMPLYFSAR
jgi:hypothetical protein